MKNRRNITIRLTREQYVQLEIVSKIRGQTVSEVVRNIVIDDMDTKGILPIEHSCSICGKTTFGIKEQLCEECDWLYKRPRMYSSEQHSEPHTVTIRG